MKYIATLLIALATIAATPAVYAQDRSQELAVELIEQYGATDLIMSQVEASGPHIVAAFRTNIPDLTEPEGDMIVAYFMEEMRALMPEFTQGFAAIYAEQFTEAELREMLDDPNTTLDGRMAERQPVIAEQADALGQSLGQQAMNNAMPRIIEMLENR